MVKSLREFEYFYCILENRNFTSKIKKSKVTDYAALTSIERSERGKFLFIILLKSYLSLHTFIHVQPMHWLGAKVHVTLVWIRIVDESLCFSMTNMIVCVMLHV